MHSFASNYWLWDPDIARTNYKETIKQQVLADRAACLLERYRGKDIGPREFEERWGEPPLGLSIIRGPRFLRRLPRTEEEGPDSEADGYTDLELDGDSEWETETDKV